MKRLLIATAATAIALFPTPAFAASANIPNLSSGAVVSNTITVTCQGSGPTGIAKVELFINGSSVAKKTPNGIERNASTSYNWHTNGLKNGVYNVKCTATENSGAADTESINVTVDNVPSTPTGVSAAASGDSITVTWNANPEPDITGYRVERDSGGGFSAVATVSGTSHVDSPGPGNHSYRVVALRSSNVSGTKASDPSAAASAHIAPPPDPEPGEQPGSGGNSGGNGGNAGNSGGGSGGNSGGNSGGGFPGFGGGGGNSGGGVVVEPRRVGQSGLPSFGSLTLPGVRQPTQPSPEPFEWGTYDEELPYAATGSQPKVLEDDFQANRGIAARSPERIIPPDGLRWVAMGILLLVTALFLRFLAGRVGGDEQQTVAAALAGMKAEADKRDAA